ncbi:MAG: ECF-type sigma factor [Pseudomonadota bacterium]
MRQNDSTADLFGETDERAVFRDIEAIAAAKLSQESNSSLSTGDLVNEAVARLTRLEHIEINSREHILALASRMMRQILIDQARRRNAGKRYHTRVTLVPNLPQKDADPLDLLSFGLVFDELREIDPQLANIVEMRYFGGMSLAEIASVLNVSIATAKRRWASARIWLREQLDQ